MGDVYRATDVRLERDVALKLLAKGGGSDSQSIDRFLQEARVTASLDHPNVVKVFDVGLFEERPYLVAELLDGETLRERIARGPIAPEHVRQIAVQVAKGLVAAHAAGLVHRDLKPENIFLTRSEVTKILDFGIAKLNPQGAGHDRIATLTHVVLGTAGYLAPEQIRGEPVDGRTDLFAVGAILFEMLTGARPFAHQHTIDTLHAILHEPTPTTLAEMNEVPAPFTAIVTRLLEKAPTGRFQSAADLMWALEQVAGTRDNPQIYRWRNRDPTVPSRWIPRGAAVAAIIIALGSGGLWLRRQEAPQPRITGATRFTWLVPAGMRLDSAPVVSPDSRHIVFAGTDKSDNRLFVRALDSLEATSVAGTEGAKQPFWSPDSKWVGFFASRKLMKVALAGGAPVAIADAPDGRGGAWSPSGIIVFGPNYTESALARVSADGGPVEPATLLDESKGDNSHRWPMFLPDGIHFLYFIRASVDERRGVYLGRVDRPASRPDLPLFRSESEAVYAPMAGTRDGVLLHVVNGRVEARSFDPTHLAFIGDARTIAVTAGGITPYHTSMLSASADVLAFAATPVPYGNRLGSVDRNGSDLRISDEREAQGWPRVSPDGRRLARHRIDAARGNPDIWVDDLERGTRVRVTTALDQDNLHVWSPDGSRLAYQSGRFGRRELSIVAADGTGVVSVLPCPRSYCEPTDWSADGQRLIVNVRAETGTDVWAVAISPGGLSQPILAESFTERDARLSPDGQWLAYVSEESGRPEVSVRSLSGPSRRFVISGEGGDQPVWRRDGAELLFVDAQGRLRGLSVRREEDGSLIFGVPVALNVPPIGTGHWGTQYDVSPDGRRVYFMDRGDEQLPNEIGILLGWNASLK
jgi:Tol biopolymer transport system component